MKSLRRLASVAGNLAALALLVAAAGCGDAPSPGLPVAPVSRQVADPETMADTTGGDSRATAVGSSPLDAGVASNAAAGDKAGGDSAGPAPAEGSSNSAAASTTEGLSPARVERSVPAERAAPPAATKTRPAPRRAPAAPGRPAEITFDDLEFPIERDADFRRELLTEQIKALDGQTVIVRGYIHPSSAFKLSGLDEFVLVRDKLECCFGPGAYIYHNIQVEMEPGQSASFTSRPIAVEGVFRLKEWFGPDDKCYSIFHVKAKRAGL